MAPQLEKEVKVWHLLIAVILPFAGAGVAWGNSQANLQNTQYKLDRVEQKVEDYMDRIARIETKIDILLEER